MPENCQSPRRPTDAIRAAARAVPDAHALIGAPTAVGLDKTDAQAHDRRTAIALAIGALPAPAR